MSGHIEYTELIAAILEARGRIDTVRVAEAFDRLDVKKNGHISKEVNDVFECVENRNGHSRLSNPLPPIAPIFSLRILSW